MVIIAAVLLAACTAGGSSATEDTLAATGVVTVPSTVQPIADRPPDRPFDVVVPTSYDGTVAVPLVILLHGYTSTGEAQDAYFGLQPLAEARGFLYVHPDGTTDSRGDQFWNATDACCNLMSSAVDDSAYLEHLIEQVEATYLVDTKRIFLIGHSNGGFMSYRMACDHADTVAAIVSLAGATFADAGQCRPSQPVSVLQIHGTADSVIAYEGGSILGHDYPGAPTSVSTWATYNGCGAQADAQAAALDLDREIPGAEASVSAFPDCPAGGAVELWTIEGGAHTPLISSTFVDSALDFLFAHPKP